MHGGERVKWSRYSFSLCFLIHLDRLTEGLYTGSPSADFGSLSGLRCTEEVVDSVTVSLAIKDPFHSMATRYSLKTAGPVALRLHLRRVKFVCGKSSSLAISRLASVVDLQYCAVHTKVLPRKDLISPTQSNYNRSILTSTHYYILFTHI